LFTRLPAAPNRPTAVICHTVKGKGIPFAENDPKWHHQSRFDAKTLQQIYDAVGRI
jgi:transketolase